MIIWKLGFLFLVFKNGILADPEVTVNTVTNLVNLRFREGEIKRDADSGTPVFFEAPLRATKNNTGQISIEVDNEAASQAFGVFPTVLSPGDAFNLVLRDVSLIPVMDKENIFEVPIKTKYLNNPSDEFERFSVFVRLLEPELEIPRIRNTEHVFRLSQRLTEGIVGKIGIQNLNKTDLTGFKYELFGGFTDIFSIEVTKEGLYLLTTGCDPEVCLSLPSNFTILLRVTPIDDVGLQKTEISLFHFSISKENMIGPHFPKREYSTSIVENSENFLEVVQLEAVDPDFRESQEEKNTFKLTEPSEVFEIDSVSGLLKVKNPSLISVNDLGELVNLMVEVWDGKNSPDFSTVKIRIISKNKKIEENFENFEFDQVIYAFAIVPRQTFVGKIGVAGGHRAEMRIVEGGSGYFVLNDESGQLDYIGPVERNSKNHTLEIIGIPKSDSPKVAMTTVQVLVAGIGSFSPVFEKKFETIFVEKNIFPESVIHKIVAEDLDKDASLVFSTESRICRDFLSKEIPCKNEIVLHPNGEVVVKKISPELMTMTMNVSVSDKTHKMEDKDYVSILTTIRRQKPKIDVAKLFNFEKSEDPLILSDDLPVGSYVFTPILKPLSFENSKLFNPTVKYSITSGSKYFRIDENSGMIYTVNSLKNIGKQNISILADVVVGNRNLNVSTVIPTESVKMDVDPPEVKNEIKLIIEENTKIGSEIGKVEIRDSEGGKNFFEILKNEKSKKIEIDENGKIKIFDKIDFEKIKKFLFFIKVTNQLEKSTVIPASIKIQNLNDNPPIFGNFRKLRYLIFENAPVGSFVGRVEASDSDGDKLFYFLNFPDENLRGKISITSDGILETEGPLVGLEGVYGFKVTVEDGIHSSTVDSELTILTTNRCQPSFVQNQEVVFRVDSEAGPGTVIGDLRAVLEDPDCPAVEFGLSLLEPEYEGLIKIEKNKLKLNSEISKFEGRRIPTVISANSGSLFSRRASEIRILSKKKKKLQYPQSHVRIEVDENRIGRILNLKPISKEKIYYKLIDDFDGLFKIENGILEFTRPADKEKNDFYRLRILASVDGNFEDEFTDEMMVNVFINDINDNSPKFEQNEYERILDSKSLPGTSVLKVFAQDLDRSQKNPLFYEIISSIFKQNQRSEKFNNIFNISKTSGEIRILKSLIDFEGGCFELGISAKNEDSETTTSVRIWIADKKLHVIPFLIHQNPIQLTSSQLKEYNKKLSNAIFNSTLLFSLKFYSVPIDETFSKIVRDATLAEFIAVDKKTNKIIPWINLKNSIDDLDIDGLSFHPGFSQIKNNFETSESSLLLLSVIFILLLILVFLVFGILICYYRRKFENEKSELVRARIAAVTDQRSQTRKWSPYLVRPPELLWERTTATETTGSRTPERRGSYSIQEMKVAMFS